MRFLFVLLSGLALSLLPITHLQAQAEDERTFAVVDYMYVAPGTHKAYLACENAWKLLHQKRVEAGEIESWEVEEVVYSGVPTDYNYMTITLVKGWLALEQGNTNWGELVATLPADQRKYVQNADEYRTWVGSEIWVIQDNAGDGSDTRPLYRVENFCDLPSVPGTWDNYMSMEKEFAKPVIEQRIKTGKQAGWLLSSLYRSRGTAYPYHVSTVDFFNSWEAIAARDNESWETVYPAMTDAQIDAKIYSAKIPVRSEIRKLVLYTE